MLSDASNSVARGFGLFLFSPNNLMPAIIDRDTVDHGEAVTVFESGAILLYLAEKTGLFLPADMRGRRTATERKHSVPRSWTDI